MTPELAQARLGKLTASRIADAFAKTRTGWGASRANYMAELIAERLTGTPTEGYTTPAMQRGTEMEPEARNTYAFHIALDVRETGFCPHPTIAMAGASPDGLVGEDGCVEFKCPNTATHIETLLGAAIPDKYVCQIQWQLCCTERKWCDFVSYDPRLSDEMCLHVQRVYRDDKRIAELEKLAVEFLMELDAKVSALTNKYRIAA